MAANPIPSVIPAEVNGELRNRVQQIRLDDRLGQVGSGGNSALTWLPWMLCLLLSLSWAGIALRSYRNTATAPRATSSDATPSENSTGGAKEVASSTSNNSSSSSPTPAPAPALAAGTVVDESKGYLIAAQKIAVSPIDIGGRLLELNITEGLFYKEGTVLARIDPVSYQASNDEALAALQAAKQRLLSSKQRRDELRPISEKSSPIRIIEVRQLKAQVDEARASQRRANDEYKRMAPLAANSPREVEMAKNDVLVANARVEKLEADLEVLEKGPREEKVLAAEADVKTAEAEVAAAEARLRQAAWRLANCEIRAPISGTVLTKKAERFNLVNPMAFGATSGSICDMADLGDLEVEIDIAERNISKLKVGMECRIRVDAYKDRVYSGYLHRIQPIASRGNSVVPVRVKLRIPDDEKQDGSRLKPEMGAVVTFLAGK